MLLTFDSKLEFRSLRRRGSNFCDRCCTAARCSTADLLMGDTYDGARLAVSCAEFE